ncbi:hypothetical protein [Posidoniimonas polymericola]|uniref:hypothetical protein n=1 Tax=Posidoniimonas polymericola TaxID=2528002 RepID=UPI0011B51178|nr:hypothetical protein [Posidoniimonas polymericola]
MKNEEFRFCVPLEGTVVAIGKAGEVLLQHQTTPPRATEKSRLVTVAVHIDSSRVEPASAYGPVDSPDRLKGLTELAKQVGELQVRQSKLPKVRLDSMEGVRLCAWEMVEEVVE